MAHAKIQSYANGYTVLVKDENSTSVMLQWQQSRQSLPRKDGEQCPTDAQWGVLWSVQKQLRLKRKSKLMLIVKGFVFSIETLGDVEKVVTAGTNMRTDHSND